MTTLETVTKEIVGLHDFFAAWFNGTADRDQLHPRFLSRLHPEILFIPPEGQVMNRAILQAGFDRNYGSTLIFALQSAMWIFAISMVTMSLPLTQNGKQEQRGPPWSTMRESPQF